MIFLSASGISRDSTYNESIDRLATRDAIIAFVRYCAKHDLPFYFGGHPAITPLILEVLRDNKEFLSKIKLYQSRGFAETAPRGIGKFNLHWTSKQKTRKESLSYMRACMLKQNKDTNIIIVIGGKEGVVEEVEMFKNEYPSAQIFPLAGTGGAARELYKKYIIEECANYKVLQESYAFELVFDKLFKGRDML